MVARLFVDIDDMLCSGCMVVELLVNIDAGLSICLLLHRKCNVFRVHDKAPQAAPFELGHLDVDIDNYLLIYT